MARRTLPRRRLIALTTILALVMAVLPIGLSSAGAASATSAAKTPAFAALATRSGLRPTLASATAGQRVNVRWRPGASAAEIAAAAARLGFKIVGTSKLGWAQIAPIRHDIAAGNLAESLRSSGLAREAKAPVTYKAADVTPNDPLFPQQWALRNTGQLGGTAGADIKASVAWAQSRGSKDVVVAVVDEGVNYAHPDLAANMWLNTAEIPNNGIDDDHDGYVDDVRGWDFFNNDNTVYDPSDGDRHGTHVAGIIGAEADNGIGISGVTQHVRIMPVKFLGPGGGDDFAGAQAIVFAVDHGATAINCSWGGPDISDVLTAAIAYAAQHGVLLVCAAGNDGSDVSTFPSFPAASEATNVISVAASDRNDALADFSNFGETGVDLAAPGLDVTSTLPAESSGLYIDSPPYRAVYLPLQVESLESSASRDTLIERSVARLGEPTSTPILVVDDSSAKVTSETPGVRLAVYTHALADAGLTNVTTWVTDSQGTPTQAAMTGRIVIWFTGKMSFGWYGEQCVNPEEQQAIATYLDGGGRLVMASGEVATDIQYFNGFFDPGADPSAPTFDLIADYFKAQLSDLTYWNDDFHGKAGTSFAGIDVGLPSAFDSEVDQLWPTGSDAVLPIPDGGATTLMTTGQYGALSGTSMATPHVTGAIALLKAVFPSADGAELEARVLNTVAMKPGLTDKVATDGRLDVAAAMSTYPGRPDITSPLTGGRLHIGVPQTITWTPALGGAPDATFSLELGRPYTAFENGFESGTLAGFVPTEESSATWLVSTETTHVHSGVYAAISGDVPTAVPQPDGSVLGTTSGMQTTVTVPPGGATVSFWWKLDPTVDFDQFADFWADDGSAASDMLFDPQGWVQGTYELPAGTHVLHWEMVNFADHTTTGVHVALDDLKVTAHQFESIGSAGPGATSLTFTPVGPETDDAWIRIQSHKGGVDSAWGYVKGVALKSDFTPPGPPTALTATPDHDGHVAIAWTNPTDPDFSRTRVLAGTTGFAASQDDTHSAVVLEGTATVASFGPVVKGTRVYVSAFAVDGSGNWSVAATATAVAIDDTPPDPVSFLSAGQYNGATTVSWSQPLAGTFDKVTVLRRQDIAPVIGDRKAPRIFVGNGSVATDWLLPKSATQAFYTVYATDLSGNNSAPRTVHIAVDNTPPKGEIFVEDEGGYVTTSTVTVEADVTGATEMRYFTNGERDPEQAWVPFADETNVTLLPIHGTQTIEAEFRDAAGNVFSTDTDILVMLRGPLAPTSMAAQKWNVGARLSWDSPDDPSIAGYRVYLAPSSLGPWTPVSDSIDAEPGFGYYAAGLAPGIEYSFKVAAVDILDQEGPASAPATATAGPGLIRRVGANAIGDTVAASNARFAAAQTVVIAPAGVGVEWLEASSLAGSLNAPVLSVGATLSPEVSDEIVRLGAQRAVIVGGPHVVTPAVEDALQDLSITVERIGTDDRFTTAADVAREVIDAQGDMWDGRVLVVSGDAPTDMLAVAPIAYASGEPVITVRKAGVAPGFARLLEEFDPSQAIVVGGTGSVPDIVARRVSPSRRRVSGATRYTTAVALADYAVGQGWIGWEHVGLVCGTNLSRALAAGSGMGKVSGPVLFTPGTKLDATAAAAIRRHASLTDAVDLFAPTNQVGSAVAASALKAVAIRRSGEVEPAFGPGGPAGPPPGLLP